MSFKFKIVGATPTSGPPLCLKCKYATGVRSQNGKEVLFCKADLFPSGVVPFKVAECGKFHPINVPWKYEMEEIAWQVIARKRGPAGFGEAVRNENEMEVIIKPPNDNSDWQVKES